MSVVVVVIRLLLSIIKKINTENEQTIILLRCMLSKEQEKFINSSPSLMLFHKN